MKTIIAGGRNYKFTADDLERLEAFRACNAITEVVSGGAKGADTEGERWAEKHNITIQVFPANWKEHGRAAGPIRNRQMAVYADACILFPGGRGTDNMNRTAHEHNLIVYDWRFPLPEATTQESINSNKETP